MKIVYTCLHTPDDDDSPPRMMDPGQNEKGESFYVIVYNFTYYVYLWYSALCITLKGVYWAISSQNQFSV